MVDRLAVFPAYLSSLVRETVVHTEPFYQRLSEESHGRDDFIYEMMETSAMESVDPLERERYRAMQIKMSNRKEIS